MTVAPRDQISAAVVIPFSSITSGATEGKRESERESTSFPLLTPVWAPHYILFGMPNCFQIQRNAKVRKFDVASLGRQNISGFEVTMYDL